MYSLQNGALVHLATAYSSVRRVQGVLLRIPLYSWAATHSHLFNLFRVAATQVDDQRRVRSAANSIDRATVPSSIPGTPTSSDLELRKYELSAKLVDTFREDVERDGGHFLLVEIPQRGQKLLSEYSSGVEPPPQFVMHFDRLLREAKEKGIDTFDLVALFEQVGHVERDYFPHDGHFNAAGHETVARLLADRLRPLLSMNAQGRINRQ